MLEGHERFPERANIGFMQVVSRDHIKLRVYERGAGETQAAAAAPVRRWRWGSNRNCCQKRCIELPGGSLHIRWKGPGNPLFMTGPATHVYDGFIHL